MDIITREELVDLIDTTEYENRKGTGTTICYMRLKCGFDIIGTSSTHISRFNKAGGEQYAFDNAIQQLHELEEYRRRYQLHQDSIVAQANTELWNTRQYGSDENHVQMADLSDDNELFDLLREQDTRDHNSAAQRAFAQAIFKDNYKWEPSTDKDGNYVPPIYGADEKYARVTSMPVTLLRLLGKI